ncbi:MAG: hypothetical protein CSA62_12330 [Planctomycetota bacterium]|nr:MAG: hypothetical protein CSA62_12330 [Planctomycetota bacterium]
MRRTSAYRTFVHPLPFLPLLLLLLVGPLFAQQPPFELRRLSSPEQAERQAAAAELRRIEDPAQLRPLLRAAARELPDLRLRLRRALGANPKLLPGLFASLLASEEDADIRDSARAVLRAHVQRFKAAAPRDPDALYPLPIEAVDLRGIRDLIDLVDRCALGGRSAIPILLDPRLAKAGSLARRPLELEGCLLLREVLPVAQRPGRLPSPLALKICAEACLLTPAHEPAEFSAFVCRLVEQLQHDEQSVRSRAALELGRAELRSFTLAGEWLLRHKSEELRRLARLFFAARRARGHRRPADAALGRDWLMDLRQAWTQPSRRSERLWLGYALRSLLCQASGDLPDWFRQGDRPWTEDPVKLALLAELPGKEFGDQLESRLLLDAPGRAALLRCLRWSGGELSRQQIAALWKRLERPDLSLAEYKATLSLLAARGPAGFAGAQDPRPKLLYRGSFDRGVALARYLRRRPVAEREQALALVAEAQELAPGDLGLLQLCREWRRPVQSPVAEAAASRSGSRAGGILLALAYGEGPRLQPRTRLARLAILENYERLAQLLPGREQSLKIEDPALRRLFQRALGRALTRLRIAIVSPPDRKELGPWLLELLSNLQTREIGLAAAGLAMREYTSLRVELSMRLSLAAPELHNLLPILRRRRTQRPGETARCPLPPGDPLLGGCSAGD